MYSLSSAKWCKTVTRDGMAMLVGLIGLHLENESTGVKYSFVRVGCVAAGAGIFSILDSFMHSDTGAF